MKPPIAFLLILLCAADGVAEDKHDPANYPLHVKILSSAHETQFVYRGTDCTSASQGQLWAVDTGSTISGTVSSRTYATCDPNWAAHHYVFTDMEIVNPDGTSLSFLGQCTDLNKRLSFAQGLQHVGNAGSAAYGTPEDQQQAEVNLRREQPVPPAQKCNLIPGDYSGRFENNLLEIVMPKEKGKFDTVHFTGAVIMPAK